MTAIHLHPDLLRHQVAFEARRQWSNIDRFPVYFNAHESHARAYVADLQRIIAEAAERDDPALTDNYTLAAIIAHSAYLFKGWEAPKGYILRGYYFYKAEDVIKIDGEWVVKRGAILTAFQKCAYCEGYTYDRQGTVTAKGDEFVCDECHNTSKVSASWAIVVKDGEPQGRKVEESITLQLPTPYGYNRVLKDQVEYFRQCNRCSLYSLKEGECGRCMAKKPKPGKFHGYHEADPTLLGWFPSDQEGARYFGLEVEVHSKHRKSLVDQSGAFPWLCIARDGSLDEYQGAEIISAPHTFEAMRERFTGSQGKAWRFWMNGTDTTAHDQPDCGIHIHVTKAGLSPETIQRLRAFIMKSTNSPFLDIVCQRVSNKYCVRSAANERRYEALNTTGQHTIEFRLFRSNTRCDRILKNIEFVQSLIAFAETEPQFMTWKRYVRWLSLHVETYPYLCSFLMEHHVQVDSTFLNVSRRMSLSQESDPRLLTEDFYVSHFSGNDLGQSQSLGV